MFNKEEFYKTWFESPEEYTARYRVLAYNKITGESHEISSEDVDSYYGKHISGYISPYRNWQYVISTNTTINSIKEQFEIYRIIKLSNL